MSSISHKFKKWVSDSQIKATFVESIMANLLYTTYEDNFYGLQKKELFDFAVFSSLICIPSYSIPRYYQDKAVGKL